MSWTVLYKSRRAFYENKPDFESIGTDGASVEQFENARRAANLLLGSGAVGSIDADYSISLTGHANPGHVPTEKYTNDTVSIVISQLGAPKPSTEQS